MGTFFLCREGWRKRSNWRVLPKIWKSGSPPEPWVLPKPFWDHHGGNELFPSPCQAETRVLTQARKNLDTNAPHLSTDSVGFRIGPLNLRLEKTGKWLSTVRSRRSRCSRFMKFFLNRQQKGSVPSRLGALPEAFRLVHSFKSIKECPL